MTNKSLRDYINLIETAEQGVAEGIVDKVRAANYDRLSKRSYNQADKTKPGQVSVYDVNKMKKGDERDTKANKLKGVAEGSAHGYNVAKWYEKNGDQGKLTRWLCKEAGLPKDAPVYFDDADLVYGDKTIVRDALVNPKLKFNDLLTALTQATGGQGKQNVGGVYR